MAEFSRPRLLRAARVGFFFFFFFFFNAGEVRRGWKNG